MSLPEVTAAARAADIAAQSLRQAVARAVAEGKKKTDVAKAAGVTRQTLDRWIAQETHDYEQANPRHAMRDGILLMASLMRDFGHQGELAKRANGDEDMQIRALDMGRTWLPPDVWATLSEDDKAILTLANAAENRVRARQDAWK